MPAGLPGEYGLHCWESGTWRSNTLFLSFSLVHIAKNVIVLTLLQLHQLVLWDFFTELNWWSVEVLFRWQPCTTCIRIKGTSTVAKIHQFKKKKKRAWLQTFHGGVGDITAPHPACGDSWVHKIQQVGITPSTRSIDTFFNIFKMLHFWPLFMFPLFFCCTAGAGL